MRRSKLALLKLGHSEERHSLAWISRCPSVTRILPRFPEWFGESLGSLSVSSGLRRSCLGAVQGAAGISSSGPRVAPLWRRPFGCRRVANRDSRWSRTDNRTDKLTLLSLPQNPATYLT